MNQDSLRAVTLDDYEQMKRQIGVTTTRPRRDGKASDPSLRPNYDELKANPFPFYPDPLTTFDGRRVKNARMWQKVRRPELLDFFAANVYGRVPADVPAITWTVKREYEGRVGNIDVTVRELNGHADNSACPTISVDIQAQVMWPKGASGPLPVVVDYAFFMGMPMAWGNQVSWQQQVLERGWAAAQFSPNSVQPDAGYGLRQGIIGLANKGEYRKPDDWGVLRAWGWGASRLIDYLETDPLFDARRVAIEGVSRYGKSALVAMAFDERIATAMICSSGRGGAPAWRRDCGEVLDNICASDSYHWVAGNMIRYSSTESSWDALPVDQHELIALCAPRPLFISVGAITESEQWCDINGSFISTSKASVVYELLGKKGLGTDLFPGVGRLIGGDLAFRQHPGGHEAGDNWRYFLDFFDQYVVKSDNRRK